MFYLECTHQNCHMQGFTSDGKREYMYWSFTDSLVKTNMKGTMICQIHVGGGHFGGLDWHDGKVYVSFMRYPNPWTYFTDWQAFQIYVYDDKDLRLLKIIDLSECVEMKKEKRYGFQGIDGVAFGRVPGSDEMRMIVAVALETGEEYDHQLFLEVDEETGKIRTVYRIPAGNKVFGIQNLDYEEDTGCYWFTTYDASEPFMEKETLYCVGPDMKTVRARYAISTPYGFEARGNGEYVLSLQGGVNGNQSGIAYFADAAALDRLNGKLLRPHIEPEILALAESAVSGEKTEP
ncbi:MAG: hypothetical protein ILO68_07715 [Clostridia bacterium]|nr:hypothetical protein [Clostridia bacterium]